MVCTSTGTAPGAAAGGVKGCRASNWGSQTLRLALSTSEPYPASNTP